MTNTPILGIWGPDPGAGTELWDLWADQNLSIEQQLQTWHEIVDRKRNTAAGFGLSLGAYINLAPSVLIPANPFGVGVPYSLEIISVGECSVPTGQLFSVTGRVRPDSTTTWSEIGRTMQSNTGTSTTRKAAPLVAKTLIENPAEPYHAAASIAGNTSCEVRNDNPLYTIVTATPARKL